MEVTQTQISHQEPQQESYLVESTSTWEKPIFKVISVSLECTAYAGAM
jgi:coenzyme PQQ precursor peptide PqqA